VSEIAESFASGRASVPFPPFCGAKLEKWSHPTGGPGPNRESHNHIQERATRHECIKCGAQSVSECREANWHILAHTWHSKLSSANLCPAGHVESRKRCDDQSEPI
jgi:hypothetical protein